jgi:hypothetical protein
MALQTKAKKLKPAVRNNATVQAYIKKIQAQAYTPGEWEAFWKQMEPKPEAA